MAIIFLVKKNKIYFQYCLTFKNIIPYLCGIMKNIIRTYYPTVQFSKLTFGRFERNTFGLDMYW